MNPKAFRLVFWLGGVLFGAFSIHYVLQVLTDPRNFREWFDMWVSFVMVYVCIYWYRETKS